MTRTTRSRLHRPLVVASACVVLAALGACTRVNLNAPPVEDWSDSRGVQSVRPIGRPDARPDGRSSRIDSGPVATTSPIGTEGVEQRPLGQAPVTSSPLPPTGSAPLKTGPLGVKKPYSDAALAELSRPDGEASSAPPPASAAPSPATATPAAATPTVTWAWPVAGRPPTTFGNGATKGIDIPGKAGDPVLAAGDGKVTFVGAGVRGYGNFVIVRHTPQLLSVYAHNRVNLVKEGDTVTRGQKIAEVGNTESDGMKLHFEIRSDSKPVDPLKYLPER